MVSSVSLGHAATYPELEAVSYPSHPTTLRGSRPLTGRITAQDQGEGQPFDL